MKFISFFKKICFHLNIKLFDNSFQITKCFTSNYVRIGNYIAPLPQKSRRKPFTNKKQNFRDSDIKLVKSFLHNSLNNVSTMIFMTKLYVLLFCICFISQNKKVNENQELLEWGEKDGKPKTTFCFYGKRFKILQRLDDKALICLKGVK
ncbi:hypothetical protein RFI_05446 [Reticulomyxa filosa]|uniref:Uncharacterized protein n=1 Tax=Reticulomyxa filosa TaxID=46433 RepID=X6P0B1_RETFI|nr:hypothetical protein RFI_05446 [Reticulomyxa filosa]|eukprot:ETO31676.1 hypothetical protein RFI_05446 [Reticulomyxa filosa]